MLLKKRAFTHEAGLRNAWTVLTICCLPCTLTAGLIQCLLCCSPIEGIKTCFPCLTSENPIDRKASSITSTALSGGSLDSNKGLKVLAEKIKTNNWNPTELFDWISTINNPESRKINNTLSTAVYKILNEYDWDTISSNDLTDEELKIVGAQLSTDIIAEFFNKIPQGTTFESWARGSKIDVTNKAQMDGFLTTFLCTSLTPELVKSSAEKALDIIVAQRTAVAATQAQKEKDTAAGEQAGQRLGFHAVPNPTEKTEFKKSTPPPSYSNSFNV